MGREARAWLQIDCSIESYTEDYRTDINIWSAGSGTATYGSTYLGGKGFGNGDYEFVSWAKEIELREKEAKGTTRSMQMWIADDDLAEGPEYFQFALKFVIKRGWWPFVFTVNESVNIVTVWIDDDDTYELSVSPASVAEGSSATSVTVTATAYGEAPRNSRNVPIQFGASTDGATEGTDYATVGDISLSFPAGQRTASKVLEFSPTNDDYIEGDETISITSTDPWVTGTALTLADDELKNITLSASPSAIWEDGGAKTITVTATAMAKYASDRTVRVSIPVSSCPSPPPNNPGPPPKSISAPKSMSAGTCQYKDVSAFDITIAKNTKTGTGTFSLEPKNDNTKESDYRVPVNGTETTPLAGPVAGTWVLLRDDDRVKPTFSVADVSVTEGDSGNTTGTFTVSLSSPAYENTTITYHVYDAKRANFGHTGSIIARGSAIRNGYPSSYGVADYAHQLSSSFVIRKGSSSGTAEMTVYGDTRAEKDETFFFIVTDTGGKALPATNTAFNALGTIIDDDTPDITLAVNPSKVAEGGGAKTITVTATVDDGDTIQGTTDLTVEVGKSGDAAVSGVDYQAVADFTISIPKRTRSASGTFTLTPIDDSLSEQSITQSLSIEGTASHRAGHLDDIDVAGTSIEIEDDDRPVTLSVSPAKVGEGAGETTITVTAKLGKDVNAPAATDIAVSVGAKTDSATSGTDYKAVADFKVTIAKGKNKGTATFKLTPTDDSSIEGDEKISVAGTLTDQTVTGTSITLSDNDHHDITLSASPDEVDEDDSATTVTVTASMTAAATASTDVTVSVGKSTDSATSGTDYSAVSDFTVTIAKDKKKGTATFTLTPTDDDDYEGDEEISVSGTSTGRKVKATSVTIEDDDLPEVKLKLNPTKVTEDGGAKTVTITAELQDSVTLAAKTSLTISVGESSDSAKSGTDYTAVTSFDLSIWPGQSTGVATFTLTPTDDSDQEGPEKITVVGSASGLDVKNKPQIELADDDGPIVDLSISPASFAEGGGDITATVTGTMRAAKSSRGAGVSSRGALIAASKDTTVTVSVGATGDGASAGTDYKSVSDFTLKIKEGKSKGSATVTVSPIDDKVLEGDETLTATGSATGITVNGTTAKLTDNDSVLLSLSTSPSSVSEGAGATTVTVTASTGGVTSTKDVTFSLEVGGGTATSGTDYTAVDDFDLTITAGDTSGTATFSLTPTDDTLIEGNETIEVGVANSQVTPALVTISDDDDATVTLTTSPSSVAEDDSATTVTVTAATGGGTFGAAQTVSVTVGDSADSATSGADYAAVTGFDISIAKGASSGSATFTLTPTDDSSIEGDETISVDGTATGLTVNGADMTLTDDEEATITLTISPSASSIAESASATDVTVTATTANGTFPADTTLEITVGDSSDGATSGTDYAAVADFDVTISAGQTSGSASFTLTPTDDTVVEGDETITVAGTATGLTITSATITLTDDDSTDITLTTNPAELGESAAGTTVTVTASTDGDTFPADRTVSVTVGDSADGATSGTDYAAVTGFDITITAGQTSGTGTFTLTPTADTLVEGDETFTVAGTSTDLTVHGATPKLTDDDTPNFSVSVSPSSVDENASGTSITVTASTGGVTFGAETKVAATVGDSADSATSGTDYAAVTGFDVKIPAGQTSATGTFTLTPTDDTVIEGDETISVSGTTAGYTVTGASLTLAEDDETEITLSASPDTVAETDSATTITVTAATDGDTFVDARTVTVTVGKAGDAATSGTDYAAVTAFDISIAAGKTSATGTFSLTPTDDKIIEGDEALTIGGASTGLTVNDASATITDDDEPTIVLSIKPFLNTNPDALPESAGATTVTVTAGTTGGTFELDRQIHVTVGASGDAAVSGTDYAAVTAFHITISAGDTSADNTFTLTPTNDKIVEGSEALTVSGSAAGLSVTSATITLSDDDVPSMSLSTSPSSVAENASGTQVTVTASTGGVTFPDNRTVTATVGASADTAVSGTDYAAVTGFDVTISKGDSSGTATFTLTPTNDEVVEDTKTISVEGSMTSYTVSSASLSLTDDDTATIDLSLSPSSATEDGGAKSVTVTATVQDGKTLGADRTVAVSVGDSADDATSGTDYAAVTGFDITVSAGKTSATGTFTLTPTDDAIVEGDETFTVAGSSAGLTVNSATMTLTDNDTASVELSVNPTTLAEAGGAKSVTVTATVSDSKTFSDERTVSVTVGDSADGATSGTDYAAVTGFDIDIAAGETSGTATFTLTPTDDSIVEDDETISVKGASTGLTVESATMTLTDDDTAGIDLSAAPSSAAENGGAATVTVTATVTDSKTFSGKRTVSVTVGDSADGATSGTDYAAVTGFDVEIAAGETSGTATFTLTPTDDSSVEGDETITVDGTSTGLTVSSATMTLTDDDTAGIDLSASLATVSEDGGAKQVTVTATVSNDKTFAAARTVSVTVGASADSATSGTDYGAVTGFDVEVAAGETSATGTFTLTPTDDSSVEGDETITVAGTSTGLTVASATITLADDDTAGIDLSTSPSTVAEGDAATTVTVTATVTDDKTFAAARAVTVNVGAAGDGATSGTDYAAVASFDISVGAGETSATGTFTLTPTDDKVIEGEETFTVGGASTGLTVNGATMTITDNDEPNIVLDIEPFLNTDPDSLPESSPATTVTVTAGTTGGTFALDRQIHIKVGASGDTAVSGTDYAAVTAFHVTIPAGDTEASNTFTLTLTNDDIVEGKESITVSGSAAGLSVTSATIGIQDDDTAGIDLDASPSSVEEDGGARTVTITASVSEGKTFADKRTVTVTVGDSADTAVSGTDYAAVSDFDIEIAVGETSGAGTFVLTPTNDSIIEGAESLTVGGQATGLTVGSVTMSLDDDDTSAPGKTPSIDLSAAPAEVPEDGGAAEVTVTATVTDGRTFADDRTVTVSVGDSGDSAVSGTDYEAVTDFDIEIAAGETSATGTFTLTPVEDATVEGAETISILGSSGDLTIDGASVTLADGDRTALLTVLDASAAEGKAITFTLTLGNTVPGGFALDAGFTDGTATGGKDYRTDAEGTTLHFAGTEGETATISVATVQDRTAEADETFTLTLTPAGGAVQAAYATGTIVDDDPAPTVTLALSPDTISESGGVSTVTAELDRPADEDTTIAVTAAAVAPAEAADFTLAGSELVVAAGKTTSTGTVTIAAVDNDAIALDASVLVSGTAEGGRGASDPYDRALLIENDDKASLSIGEARAVEGEALAFVVTLEQEVPAGFTATPRLFDETATMGADYTNGVAEVSFNGRRGEEIVIEVPAMQDELVEGDETLRLSLSPNAPEYVLDPADATGTIQDNDRAKLSIGDASAREGRTMEFRIALDVAVDGGLTVTPTVADVTAVRNVDYAVEIVPIRFEGTAGEQRILSVETIQDELVEGAEKFVVNLDVTASSERIRSWSHAGGGVSADGHATGTIRDDDEARLSMEDASAEEGRSMTFAVTLDNEVPGGLTVTPTFTDGTATAGDDYLPNENVLPFAGTKGETWTIAVETLQDQFVENDETFGVALVAEAASGVAVETGDGASGTILDNDEVLTLSVSLNPDTIAEGETARFAIALSNPSNEVAVTVDYATQDGSATAGADYEAVAGSVTFRPGEVRREVPVLVLDDVKAEPAETFSLRILNYAGGALTLGAGEATAFIDEPDPMPAAWLARFGRTAADHAVEAVTERMEGGATGAGVFVPTGGNDLLSSFGGSYGGGPLAATGAAGGGPAWAANGGQPVGLLPNGDPSPLRRMTDREFLAASSFTAPLGKANDAAAGSPSASAARHTLGAPASPPASEENAPRSGDDSAAAAQWTAWGRGAMTRFDGREDDLSLDGEVATATVGVDVRTARWVAGVAVSHSAGDGGYEAPAADDSGTLDSALTSVTPYARFALNDRVSLWGVLGQGGGNLTLRQDRTGESIRASLDMSMAALGLRGVVLPAERANGFELAVRTDAMAVWTDSDAAGDMLAAETETSRLRLTLEGSRAFEAGDGGSLVPTLELGLRHDDGDAERGFGLELGARLAYAAPGGGLAVEGHVRGVLAHEDEGYEALSFGGSIRFDPGVEGRGLALAVTPSRGDSTGGVERMWSPHQQSVNGGGFQDRGDRIETLLSYGLAGPRGRGDLVPYAGVEQWGNSRSFLLGGRWEINESMRLEVRATHRQGLGDGPADNGIQFDFTAGR